MSSRNCYLRLTDVDLLAQSADCSWVWVLFKISLWPSIERLPRQVLDPRVAGAIRYLYVVDSRASVSELARGAGMSQSRFRRLFARQVGIAPSRFCLQARLDAACAALSAGKSLKEAAALAGY